MMSENSKIEWTDHTFNPWEGCTKVGPGCDHCYAEVRNARFAGGESVNWGAGAPRRRTSESNWNKPLKWNAEADAFFAVHGRRQRVFCASLADVFDNEVPKEWRRDLFKLIEETPNLDWLLLTKRIGNVLDMVPPPWLDRINFRGDWPANVWIGATIVNQEEADRDIPKLQQVPSAVRFLSMEPLLGPVNITRIGFMDGFIAPLERPYGIDWVIVGGESGPHARPMHPDWARAIRDQCYKARVPFLFKQWGEWEVHKRPGGYYRPDGQFAEWWTHKQTWFFTKSPNSLNLEMRRVGKKAAGRELDGITHDGYPKVSL